MYDTIKAYLPISEANLPVSEITKRMQECSDIIDSIYTLEPKHVFKIWIKHYKIFIEGSLCKFYFGNNVQTLTREQAVDALDMLEIVLRIPINKFIVSRLDFTENIRTIKSPSYYIDSIEGIDKWKDIKYSYKEESTGKLFYKTGFALCIYNKPLEKHFKERYKNKNKFHINNIQSHQDLDDRNLLRMEMRFLNSVGKKLIGKELTIGEMASKKVYNILVKKWFVTLLKLKFREELIPCLDDIDGKIDFKNILMLGGIQFFGGYSTVLKTVRKFKTMNKTEQSKKVRLTKFIKTLNNNKHLDSFGNDLLREIRNKATKLAIYHLKDNRLK